MARVFIGMPVFNGEKFIGAHLQDFLDQTFEDFELLVGDNASSDGTRASCEEFAQRDPRIRYVRRDRNLGAAKNVNLLMEACTAPYFKLAAHDDMHAPTYLERCVEVLDSDDSVVLCHTGTRLIDESGTPCHFDSASGEYVDWSGRRWAMDPASRRLGSRRPGDRYHDMIHHTVLVTEIWGVMRHDALMQTRRFKPYFGSDRPMLAEMALRGRFHEVPEKLFALRLHPTHTTHQPWRARGDAVAPDASTLAKRFTGVQTYRDFGLAIWNAKLPGIEKIHCLLSWCSLLFNPRILHKLIVPGPHNFFGIDFRRAGPTGRAR